MEGVKKLWICSLLCPSLYIQSLFHLLFMLLSYLHQAFSHELNLLNCHPTKNGIFYWTQSPLLDWKVRKSCEHWVLPPQNYIEFKIVFILCMSPRFGQGSAGHFISVPLKLSEDIWVVPAFRCLPCGYWPPTEALTRVQTRVPAACWHASS